MSTANHDLPQQFNIRRNIELGPGRWEPQPGVETGRLLNKLVPDLGQQQSDLIIDEAKTILSQCVPPRGQDQSNCVLVIGEVQSGKTTSFTTLASLARDNGYRMVVVVAGSSVILFDQNCEALEGNLNFTSRNTLRNPFELINARECSEQEILSTVRGRLSAWEDPTSFPEERRTIFLVVPKIWRHLEKVADVFTDLALGGVPVLVIDDETDQAGHDGNSERRERSNVNLDRTRVNGEITRIRDALSFHSWVGYTGTPQANLFINTVETLSPDEVEFLTPGADYVNGRDYFIDRRTELVIDIPEEQIPDQGVRITEPPPSLVDAFQLFLVTAIVQFYREQNENCSMLVNPDRKTDPHEQLAGFLETMKQDWLEILGLSDSEPDKQELLSEFHNSFNSLSETFAPMPSWVDVYERLQWILRETNITEVNGREGDTPSINWQNFSNVVVGSQALDRGVVVKGLTTTYLTRSLGVGNVDSLIQRARFYGYKRPYLGLCRIFIPLEIANAFEESVHHIEELIESLKAHKRSGRPINEWTRAIRLGDPLRITRSSILGQSMQEETVSGWVKPLPNYEPENVVRENQQLIQSFQELVRERYGLAVWREGDDRRDRGHLQNINVPIRDILDFASQFQTNDQSQQQFNQLLSVIEERLAEYPNDQCACVFIDSLQSRTRTWNPDDNESQLELFMGQNRHYPGDSAIKIPDKLTLQISLLNLRRDQGDVLFAENIPCICWHFPNNYVQRRVIQN